MLEEGKEELSGMSASPGWLAVLGHRSKVFGALAASLSLDAIFMLIWLCIHVLFTFSTAVIENWLKTMLDSAAEQARSAELFKFVFFISTSMLDLAAFAIMAYFIFWDVRTCWRKISAPEKLRNR